ncbi:MAG: site-2 protease family protein [Clostridiales bacterium]|nr:site-2 protease family protein [Candidatus Crickella caballi]
MTGTIMTKILTLPGILLALCFHEYAHAWMSNKLGDPTPKRQGRLTVNPTAHIDVLGFVALLICGFGWGKPVQIDPYYYKNRRRDEMLVALAGVTMNLLLAVIFSFPTKLLYSAYVNATMAGGDGGIWEIGYYIFFYTVMINLCLMIFNLIPIPPLDGWNVISNLVDLRKYKWYPYVYNYGGYILIALILLNVTDLVLTPCVNFFMNLLF